MMQRQMQVELSRRYPNLFRLTGQLVIDPIGTSTLPNGLWGEAAPFDERGIECGGGWFAMIDRLSHACENEITTLIAQGALKKIGRALPKLRKNWAACVSTSMALYPSN